MFAVEKGGVGGGGAASGGPTSTHGGTLLPASVTPTARPRQFEIEIRNCVTIIQLKMQRERNENKQTLIRNQPTTSGLVEKKSFSSQRKAR